MNTSLEKLPIPHVVHETLLKLPSGSYSLGLKILALMKLPFHSKDYLDLTNNEIPDLLGISRRAFKKYWASLVRTGFFECDNISQHRFRLFCTFDNPKEKFITFDNSFLSFLDEVSGNEKKILAYIYRLTQGFDKEICTVSHSAIAEAIGVGRRAVIGLVDRLTDTGFLLQNTGGFMQTNQYSMHPMYKQITTKTTPICTRKTTKTTPICTLLKPFDLKTKESYTENGEKFIGQNFKPEFVEKESFKYLKAEENRIGKKELVKAVNKIKRNNAKINNATINIMLGELIKQGVPSYYDNERIVESKSPVHFLINKNNFQRTKNRYEKRLFSKEREEEREREKQRQMEKEILSPGKRCTQEEMVAALAEFL